MRNCSGGLPIESLEGRLLLADMRFAVVGDFSAGQPLKDVSNLIKSWNPAFVVTTGDNNYPSGSASTIDANIGQYFHQYISPYKGTYGAGSADGQNHFWPSLGNHDWDASGATPYLNYFTLPGNERYYTVQQGNVGLFVVDSDSHEPDGNSATSTQANWLKSALAASSATFKLVIAHHPPYSSESGEQSAWMRWPFRQWGATAVLNGHSHNYERLVVDGLPYFVDGLGGENIVGFDSTATGSQVRYAGDFGAMLLTAGDTSLTFQFFARTGALIDTYTVGVQAAPAAPTNLTAAVSGAAVNLAWTASGSSGTVTSFKIERSTDNAAFTQIAAVGSTVTTYADAGAEAGNTYYYRVRASNSGGNSAYSNTASVTTPFSAALIAPGATWKYLDNGSDQGSAWRASSFSDSAWKSGAAEFGYGDGDERTAVDFGSNSSNKFITTYFRKTFSVADPSSLAGLSLQLVRDDGAVVYLNGTEVYRSNMPTGTIGYRTLASTNVGGADESTWFKAAISSTLLVAGTNVVAVEIHQSVADSSDLSFNLQLSGSTDTPPPPSPPPAPTPPAAPTNLAGMPFAPTRVDLSWNDNSTDETGFKVERSSNGGTTYVTLATTAANVVRYSDTTAAAGTSYLYRVRATNGAGDSGSTNAVTVVTPTAVTYVSDIPWISSTNGWGPAERNKSNGSSGAGDGKAITLHGVAYNKGIGTHANSQIVVKLGRSYTNFLADIGLDDEKSGGSVVYQMVADGVKVFDSGIIRSTTATRSVSLDVTGVDLLTLIVTDAGDGIDFDHADWAGARLV